MRIEQSAGTATGALAGIFTSLRGAITLTALNDTVMLSIVGALVGFIVSTLCKHLWAKINWAKIKSKFKLK